MNPDALIRPSAKVVLATLPGLNGFAQILRATWTKKHGPFSDDDLLQDEDLANKLEEDNLPRGGIAIGKPAI